MQFLVCSLWVAILFVVLVGKVGARQPPSEGSSSSMTSWSVPSHLSAERGDSDWIQSGLANEESLTSLIDREKADGFEVVDEDNPSVLGLIARGLYLMLLFSPAFWTSGLALVSTQFRNEVWFRLLCWAIENSGAAFIKWGQWSSTRPDMFPIELCDRLATLHSGAPVHSFKFTQSSIKAELGSEISDIFSEFDEKPIASGSIAQVYRAVLNGELVAVKVRHPNVREQIVKDFKVMKWLANFVENVLGMRWLNLGESLSQFSGTIASQTRLDVEGWHLYLFNKNFGRWKDVMFPRPIVITESVLVESFEYGDTVSKYAKIKANNGKSEGSGRSSSNSNSYSSSKAGEVAVVPHKEGYQAQPYAPGTEARLRLSHFIVCRGEDIYLKMLMQDNLMHADMHPGNILVDTSQEVASAAHKIVMVDAGMVAQLVTEERKYFIGMLAAVGEGKGAECAECVLNFSASTTYSEDTKRAFTADMVEFFDRSCRGYGTDVDLGETLRGILALCRIHKVTVSANYATLIMNVLCLDGMASSLLPTYNLLDGAQMFLTFYRFCARKKCLPLVKVMVPLARRLKALSDKKFLKKEKRERGMHAHAQATLSN